MFTSPHLAAAASPAAPLSSPPRSRGALDSGLQREDGAIPATSTAALPARDSGEPARSRRVPFFRTVLVAAGATGLLVAGAGAGVYAFDMGYDWRMTARIAGLAGAAGAAAAVLIPLLFRALGWIVLAAITAAFGAGALYTLSLVAPAFTDQVVSYVDGVIR